MLVIGLTGGIGSGKSTVAKFFKDLGIPIYYTDIEAKRIINTSKIIKRKLLSRFGSKVYENDRLNRPVLAELIFTNKENLQFVNNLIHPKVNQHFKRWIKKQSKNKDVPYVIQENAILFENGSDIYCDFVITVTAPEEVRINRVINRDKVTKEQVLDRINNQWSEEDKVKKSDFIISNFDLSLTKEQVIQTHNEISKL